MLSSNREEGVDEQGDTDKADEDEVVLLSENTDLLGEADGLILRLFCPWPVGWNTRANGSRGSAHIEPYPSQVLPNLAQLLHLFKSSTLTVRGWICYGLVVYLRISTYLGLASSHRFRRFLQVRQPDRDHLAPSLLYFFVGPGVMSMI